MNSINLVMKSQVIEHWTDTYKPLINRALNEDPFKTINTRAIFQGLVEGAYLLADIRDAENKELFGCVVFTKRVKDLEPVTLFGIALAGKNIDSWAQDLDQFLQCVAEGLLCERIVFSGRMGWIKKLKKLGYEPAAAQLIKEL